MKKIRREWLLAGALIMNTPLLQAADITITVNGRVVAKPCTIDTTHASVDLGDLYTFNLATAGSVSDWHSTTLDLSNCPVGTSRVTATFSGTTDSTGYYKNQGSADNIQIELQDSSGTALSNGVQKTVTVDDSSHSVHFPLQIRALSVNGGAMQGTIQAVISVTYTYA